MRRRLPLSPGPHWGDHPAILHLDIDAFFASVEQLRHPALGNRPVAVGSGVVASASYEARACGVRAGTPLHEARRLCPDLVMLAGHAPTYRAFAEQVFALAAELSPNLETYLDDALVDLSGTERLHGHLVRAAARLQRRIRTETGLSVSLGLATNRMVARMVTRQAKPGGFAWLRPGGEFAFVGRRAVEELPGVGPRRAALLREMGIERSAEVRRLSHAQLRDLFGELGLAIAARARGRETRVLEARELPRSIRRETSFDEPQTDRVALEGMLHYLVERSAAQARRLAAEPGAVRVHLRWADGDRVSRGVRLVGGGAVTEKLFSSARLLLRSLRTRRAGIRNLGVELSSLQAPGELQIDLFGDGHAADAGAAGAAVGGAA
ncbi:MAG: DNA polymerase IV, partial [Candidatus Eisenbacteria sp.]|nr:DNA polymerase IV [Candidatus Eisenbacteria bacterium]